MDYFYLCAGRPKIVGLLLTDKEIHVPRQPYHRVGKYAKLEISVQNKVRKWN